MNHPQKWRETVDPFELKFKNFKLNKILGYPHAGNDVFHVKGEFQEREVEAYIKVARQVGADIKNEIETINKLGCSLAPKVIDFDSNFLFCVTLARDGERLSSLLGDNADMKSLDYLYEYGQALAQIHSVSGEFTKVKDRRFFHIPDKEYFDELSLEFVHDYLIKQKPKAVNECFCHGDFHYANLLWKDGHLSAILDFELSGLGNKEFDIAWALIRRPGQAFMVKREEIELFLSGYSSVACFDLEYLKYYMALVYSYFYKIGIKNSEYVEYVKMVFDELCKR